MIIADPFETQNKFSVLTDEEKRVLHDTLDVLKRCRGKECTLARHHTTNQNNNIPGSTDFFGTGEQHLVRTAKRKIGKFVVNFNNTERVSNRNCIIRRWYR